MQSTLGPDGAFKLSLIGIHFGGRLLAPLTTKFAPEPALDPIPEPPWVSALMHTAGPRSVTVRKKSPSDLFQ
jgi:hypothetical protein